MKNSDLTIVLPLRGRHLHTLRWLWHANSVKLPYHVIIADGEVHPTIDRLLSDPTTFRNLSFEYHRHCDLSFSDFYKKCTETMRKVRTDFAMMSDNDDFPIIAGIDQSVEHLKSGTDFACAGGQLPDFSVVSHRSQPGKVIGRMERLRFGYAHQCRDISFSSASERVMNEIHCYQTIYYHVYRTEVLRRIFQEVEGYDFSDLTVHEYYCALRTATLGKVRTDPSVICYLRQIGTSSLPTYWKDWVHHLLRSKLPEDFRAMATAIADEVQKAEGGDSAAFREDILDAYASKLRHMLGHTMMRHRFPGLFRIKQKLSWLTALRVVPAWYREWRGNGLFWKKLVDAGAEPALLAAYRKELKDIETSLRGDEFLSFLSAHAPDLLGKS